MDRLDVQRACGTVLAEVISALRSVDAGQVVDYAHELLSARRVFFTGVGRSLLSMEAAAKRYAHLGIDAVVVGQITEPAITPDDLLVIGSCSGETLFPIAIARRAKQFGAKVVHIGSVPDSSLSEYEDLFVRIPVESRVRRLDEVPSSQPMTTLFEQSLLLLGDMTALLIMREKHLRTDDLWPYHANLE